MARATLAGFSGNDRGRNAADLAAGRRPAPQRRILGREQVVSVSERVGDDAWTGAGGTSRDRSISSGGVQILEKYTGQQRVGRKVGSSEQQDVGHIDDRYTAHVAQSGDSAARQPKSLRSRAVRPAHSSCCDS
ncbi:hypothetical protein K0M31_016764 [Melipona bicolor]|uniref:Uncharacterized protein n=1 Tax=Melipona bicolor TaxID=60889 RepID=A0AA40FEA3_9HYME|nr:hypothetical protein K0M31_016764 [Melipona bicolor]